MNMDRVRRDIQNRYKKLQNWRAVGAALGISGGMAYRIAVDGYEPKDVQIRLQLGLAALAPAPVCRRCGQVHVSRHCPQRRKYHSIWDMPVEVLRWKLMHREEL